MYFLQKPVLDCGHKLRFGQVAVPYSGPKQKLKAMQSPVAFANTPKMYFFTYISQFVQLIDNLRCFRDECLVSCNVVSLFTSISMPET